ncbi:MAG: hypothetical protein M1824_006526 [Vezdaea acicularis]|nr:MAG: hypothetical protein M1824_006526 [Vezdaea acicularis]
MAKNDLPVLSSGMNSFVLLILSLIFLPFDTFILFYSYALRPLFSRRSQRASALRDPAFTPRTVLITGLSMAKGLALARAFHNTGHSVIGADFEDYRIPVNGRFSRSLKRFYKLPRPTAGESGGLKYIESLLSIITSESCQLWVSCSGVTEASEDGEAAELIKRLTRCKVVQFERQLVDTLHEKQSFIEKTKALGLQVPETHPVTSTEDALRLLESKKDEERYILKSVHYDNATRGDMTLLPLQTPAKTEGYLSKLDISLLNPWVLQQFISGKEYCTHALVLKNEIRAFVACPSSDLLMHYQALPVDSGLAQSMLAFTKEFMRGIEEEMTGHLSFDFLVREKATKNGVVQVLYCIECNPRAHTAVVLFEDVADVLIRAYMDLLLPELPLDDGFVGNPAFLKEPRSKYWIGHDLVSFVLHPLLKLLAGRGSFKQFQESMGVFMEHVLFWRDGTFELWDPLPWWALYHIYFPAHFLLAIFTGKRWSRINERSGLDPDLFK